MAGRHKKAGPKGSEVAGEADSLAGRGLLQGHNPLSSPHHHLFTEVLAQGCIQAHRHLQCRPVEMAGQVQVVSPVQGPSSTRVRAVSEPDSDCQVPWPAFLFPGSIKPTHLSLMQAKLHSPFCHLLPLCNTHFCGCGGRHSPRGNEEGVEPVISTLQHLQADPPTGRAVVLIGLGHRVQVHSQIGLRLLRQIALWGQHTQYQTATEKLITLRTPYKLLPRGLRAM